MIAKTTPGTHNPRISAQTVTNRLREIGERLPYTRDVFYVRREVDFLKTVKVNAYIMHIFGKIELLSIHAT